MKKRCGIHLIVNVKKRKFVCCFLCACPEEQRRPDGKEDYIGNPGGKDCRQYSRASQGHAEGVDYPVGKTDYNADSDALHHTSLPLRSGRKGNPD